MNLPEPRFPLIAYKTAEDAPRIRPAPLRRAWMDRTGDSFANRCLPLLMANQYGWFVLNNFSFIATWSGDDAVEAVEIEYGSGNALPMASSHFGYGIITFNIPLLFRTPTGWDMSVRGPANIPKDGVCPLEGIDERDWASASFTMNWKITRPGIPIHFARDEPICMISPQARGTIEQFNPILTPVASEPEIERLHAEWGRSRDEFLSRSMNGNISGPQWQRDYMRGQHVNGERTNSHRTRIHLQDFRPADSDRTP
ncbi:hypothetical protein IU459_36700 [Nocardia amamiensis]|uniref:Uncharacterized protein n=1 Tax=Nocardia amamiensis TaxID=404578 RepID=A0ABS0D2D9_9NOCA|nr:DUF6065 family protein [Nocardia amamiensis]MBF6303007.1 hypothetical protein [Nocardia amamiensis]